MPMMSVLHPVFAKAQTIYLTFVLTKCFISLLILMLDFY